MTQSFSLPSGCQIRPARLTDYPAILRLNFEFGRSLQQSGSSPWLQCFSAYLPAILAGVIAILLAIVVLLKSSLTLLLLSVTVIVAWLGIAASWVVECQGKAIAQATLYCYEHHSELYSLCVLPEWRHRRLGSGLVQYLTLKATLPLYLAARPELIDFYTGLGFTLVAQNDLPDTVRKSLGIDRYQNYGIVALVLRSPDLGFRA